MKQTAVEWLVEQLARKNNEFQALTFYYDHKEEIEQAKQMEKEQSLNFAKHCLDKAKDLDVRTAFLNVEQYYKRNL